MSQEVVTGEIQIQELRKRVGELKLTIGDLEFPCRFLTALEEASTVATARMHAKVPSPDMRKEFEGIEIQKQILQKACTLGVTPHMSRDFLDQLSATELERIYDQYISLVKTANPVFESLTQEQILALVEEVKKKKLNSSALFSWQLAEIGKFFLDKVVPRATGPGY